MIATRTRIGPHCHGEPVPLDLLGELDYETGHSYEIIDGRWYVAPIANAPEGFLGDWLKDKLREYTRANPAVANKVFGPARVFIPNQPDLTVPEPDIALYHDFPLNLPIRELDWEDVSPLLVVEVLVDSDPQKDLVRNVELYFDVPSIAEYWVLDGSADPDRPTLLARRRWGSRWVLKTIAYGDTYTTRTLPGFSLLLDPRQ